MHIEIAQIFTQIVAFLIVLWVLKRFAWKPVLKLIEDRENKIRAEFLLIEKEKKENAKLNEIYKMQLDNAAKEVKELIKQGQEQGAQEANRIEQNAWNESKKILSRTQEELKKEIYQAKKELKQEIASMALSVTEKLLKTEMDSKHQQKLIQEFLGEESDQAKES